MQETWIQSLGWKDLLEEEIATHFSILAWRIPWTEEPGGLQSIALQRIGHNLVTEYNFQLTLIIGHGSHKCCPQLLVSNENSPVKTPVTLQIS